MDRDSVVEVLKEVIGPNVALTHTEGWVNLSCPLAPWTHSRGVDSNASAGVSVHDDDTSIFNCFTCNSRGSLGWLLRQLMRYTGEDYTHLVEALERGEFFGGAIPEWGAPKGEPPMVPLDEHRYLDLYDPAENHPYLRKRGITRAAARMLGLLHDPGDGKPERILFPVYGYPDRELYGFTGRAVDPTVLPRIKDYHGLPKRKLLLGSQLVHPDDAYIILVEGLFDCAKLVGYGYPAVAMMGAVLTEYQANVLIDIGKPVYFFHDNDGPGEEARERVRELLWQHLPVMKVRYPKDATIVTRKGDSRPPKDPAELQVAQVERMIEEARLL